MLLKQEQLPDLYTQAADRAIDKFFDGSFTCGHFCSALRIKSAAERCQVGCSFEKFALNVIDLTLASFSRPKCD